MWGCAIKTAVMGSLPLAHPYEEDLGFLYGTIFVGRAHDPAHHSRNVCVFADGEVDRCPTGTGVSARAAIHYARGELRRTNRLSSRAFWERHLPVRWWMKCPVRTVRGSHTGSDRLGAHLPGVPSG